MNSDEEFDELDFSSSKEDDILNFSSINHSELFCDDTLIDGITNNDLQETNQSISDSSENMENFFFSSVADLENANLKDEELYDCNSEDSNFKKIKTDQVNDNHKISDDYKNDCNNVISSEPEVGFQTGNNRKLIINGAITNRIPKFLALHKSGPMRSYLCPQKGHVSSDIDEKNRYIYYFDKIKAEYKNVDLKLLIIQYRWTWLDLFVNKQLDFGYESTKLMLAGIKKRLNREFSVLRRIIEGDDVACRYIILLVLNVNKDELEVYDGYFSCKIKIDKMILKLIESKKLSMGFKIKLFGCKFLLNTHTSILDYNENDILLHAFYNSFDFALLNRVLGYRKKISFLNTINKLKKEGGIVSGLKGRVKRIVDRKYVIQVKGYRNSVENLEKEMDNIQELIEKTNENVTKEDVKIRKYVRFMFEDPTGECLITSWLYTDEITKDCQILFCGLIPVASALGLHLSTCKQTYIKFYK